MREGASEREEREAGRKVCKERGGKRGREGERERGREGERERGRVERMIRIHCSEVRGARVAGCQDGNAI